MTVEIWSDVVCPFCYIGKRRFEDALQQFNQKENVEIVWRSFQLDPDGQPAPGTSLNQYLAERKGISLEEAKQRLCGSSSGYANFNPTVKEVVHEFFLR